MTEILWKVVLDTHHSLYLSEQKLTNYCLIDVQWQIHVHVFHLIVRTRTSFNDL
jgi:hypothetical protein